MALAPETSRRPSVPNHYWLMQDNPPRATFAFTEKSRFASPVGSRMMLPDAVRQQTGVNYGEVAVPGTTFFRNIYEEQRDEVGKLVSIRVNLLPVQ
jgi:hypothetical protein